MPPVRVRPLRALLRTERASATLRRVETFKLQVFICLRFNTLSRDKEFALCTRAGALLHLLPIKVLSPFKKKKNTNKNAIQRKSVLQPLQ